MNQILKKAEDCYPIAKMILTTVLRQKPQLCSVTACFNQTAKRKLISGASLPQNELHNRE